ncbi:MAG: hypothetical protein JJU05_02875 [Verrucomicrobia bacterium]|nr:hypothetical protein [Verrucomicrobiota bacterium]
MHFQSFLIPLFLLLNLTGFVCRAEYPYGFGGQISRTEFNLIEMLEESDVVVIARIIDRSAGLNSIFFEVDEILYPKISIQVHGKNYFTEIKPDQDEYTDFLEWANARSSYVGHTNLYNRMERPFYRLKRTDLIKNIRYILFLKHDYENTDLGIRRRFSEDIILPEHAVTYTVVNAAKGIIPELNLSDDLTTLTNQLHSQSSVRLLRDMLEAIHHTQNFAEVFDAVVAFQPFLYEPSVPEILEILTNESEKRNKVLQKYLSELLTRPLIRLRNRFTEKNDYRRNFPVMGPTKSRPIQEMIETLFEDVGHFQIDKSAKRPQSKTLNGLLDFIEENSTEKITFIRDRDHPSLEKELPERYILRLFNRDDDHSIFSFFVDLTLYHFLDFSRTEDGIKVTPY